MLNWDLYVIIDKDVTGVRDPLDVAQSAILGGCDVIQLRDKTSPARACLKLAYSLRVLTKRADIAFIINDRADIAMAVDADGIHLGQDDLPIAAARKFLGADKIIGISTHSLKEALEAQEEGADYISAGPIFETPLKPDLASRGIALIREVKENILIPFVAIGGIRQNNIDSVLEAGAETVAVIRAVTAADDVEAAARILKKKIQKYKTITQI